MSIVRLFTACAASGHSSALQAGGSQSLPSECCFDPMTVWAQAWAHELKGELHPSNGENVKGV